MNTFLNYGMAWIAMGLTFILAIVYMTRRWIKTSSQPKTWITLNLKLRKYHKELGILLITVGFIHGLFSSFNIFSFNLGTLAWILSILLGLNYYFRVALSSFKPWIILHRWLTVAFLAVIVLHIKEVGGIAVLDVLFPTSQETSVVTLDPSTVQTADTSGILYGNFSDGTYTGSATGYGDNLTVEVVIENNLMTSIQIISHHKQRSQFYQPAFDTIPSEILQSQSLEVDTVTGSTFSSVGIINAVNDALSQALVSGTLPNDLSLPTRRRH